MLKQKKLEDVSVREQLFRERRKNEKGVTMLALIITIIILLILAGVTIVAVTGQNGLMDRAKQSKERTMEEDVKEKVQLMLADYQVEKMNNQEISLNDYLNIQKNQGKLDGVEENDDGTIIASLNGYSVVIDPEELKIIEVSNKKLWLIGKYEITGYDGSELSVKINIENKSGKIDTVTCPNNTIINGTEENTITIEYKVVDGEKINLK